MSELKFTCPSCGQHIQCETAHAGENIPCPGCATLIRIPALISPEETGESEPASIPDVAPATTAALSTGENPFTAELKSGAVSYTPLEPAGAAKQPSEVSPATPEILTEDPRPVPELPSERIDGAESHREKDAVPAALVAPELRCICPVCQSELRIPMNLPLTSDVLPARAERITSTSAPGEKSPVAQPTHEPLPLEERERKIAEARQTLQVSAHAPMKPRLSVILSENARTVSGPDSASSSQSTGQTSPPLPDIETLSE